MRQGFLDSLMLGLSDMPGKRKVLLIDDDVRDLEYLCGILGGQGHDVISCTSYDLGAKLVESGRFDFIIVSQGGREFKGRVVVERAREIEGGPPVFVVARIADMNCYLEAMQLGAADYLEKPLPPM